MKTIDRERNEVYITYINLITRSTVLCRLPNYHGDAAPVSMVETTREPAEYQHPDNPMIIFVDLPGTGTQRYPDVPTYCKNVGLEDYDTFLLFTSRRFTRNDLDLAKRVKSIGKLFFLIHTKIDIVCQAAARTRQLNEEEVLQKIKKDLIGNLRGLISSEKDIFLIGNYDKDRWDFPRLVAAINGVFPAPEAGELLTPEELNSENVCVK